MSARLAAGGRLIDRTRPMTFTFNGRALTGYAGDTLASALLANGQVLVGRSFKYHRPRGFVASGPEEPNGLFGIGRGGRFEPNQRGTTAELFDGMTAVSQNHWPSLAFDIGAINGRLSKFFPAGFYYKTFMHPRRAWEKLFEPVIRHSAGLGKPPAEPDADRYEHVHRHVDLVIAGGGIAGLQAALVAGEAGADVLVLEQSATWGGRAPVDGEEIEGRPAAEWIAATLARLSALPNVSLRLRTMAAGLYDHGYLVAMERLAEHTPGDGRPRQRLWRIRAGQVVMATGAIERPVAFAGNDLPGVMLASAGRDFLVNWGVAVGQRVILATANDDAYRSAIALAEAGVTVVAVVDARPAAIGPLPDRARALGIPVETGRGIVRALGGKRVTAVTLGVIDGTGVEGERIPCDAVLMSGGWSPVVHLWSQAGGKLFWDGQLAMFRPDALRAPTGDRGQIVAIAAGAANGALSAQTTLADATAAGRRAAIAMGREVGEPDLPVATSPEEKPLRPLWHMPEAAGPALREKMFLDFQHDVKVSDVELAAREGYESVEHTKRYTTLGMATDQGKLSNINGLAILAEALAAPIPTVGTTTFRPPYTPISFGAIAGEARGELFQPLRRTPMDDWHAEHGAHWEPVGQWRRPYTYPRKGEDHAASVAREIRSTRERVGVLDASTLGKIVVSGPDAGRFLDMIYTGLMSSLAVGRCRYGLICNENGFLIDDGVVARLSEDSFLVHTTTGGADRIHAHMEEWLQTEWWDWQVFTANVTEQYGQIAVVGPKARAVLEALGGIDVSREALPFMGWVEGELAGHPVRIYRISFSGELSFEIAVPASRARALWDAVLAAGAEHGITPYGTEALHVMRAEKGFIMIGDETDGTVIPQDLGLGWAISRKKADYIGKRAQQRSFMDNPDRWQLVGLETVDGSVLPDGALAPLGAENANRQRRVQGRVTSTYFSPTLDRGIALGLVHRGVDRMGEFIAFQGPTEDAPLVRVRIVNPVFLDVEGARQNV